MKCNFRNEKTQPVCGLRMYGGMPSYKMCERCISNNQNNEHYAKELFLRHEKSHPTSAKRISGCCDSAKNYS
jgi:hypothetical protein